MSSVTSTGLGSGLDINNIVTAIVDAEKDPAMSKMKTSSAEATAKISAYGMLNNELSTFKDSYKDLGRTSTFSAALATSSDSSVLDAKLGVGAETGSWTFEVQQRAEAQTLVSSAINSYQDSSSEVGTGTITLTYGSYNVDGTFSVNPDKPLETLTIDSSNNSLDKLRDEINKGEYSVTASIINDGDNYRLVLKNKETGEANALQITVEDDDANNDDAFGLSSLTYTSVINHMDKTSTAQDAKLIMNGVEISRDRNDISNVIEGVTLNINSQSETGKTVSLTINKDTSTVEEQINAFVENYNNAVSQMNSLTADGGEGGADGALNGDSAIRNIRNQMRSVLNIRLEHIGGAVQSFADLGMLTNRDGTLSLDSAKLSEIMSTDMQSVANFFTASGVADDSLIDFKGYNSLTKPGSYDIEVTQNATQGVLTGSAYNSFPLSLSDSNNTFTMRLDGYASEDIVLSEKSYANTDELMTELQLKINSDANFVKNGLSVTVSDLGTGFAINSNSYGSRSSLAILTSNLSKLGLPVGSTTETGVNVEGLINGNSAYGDGQILLSDDGDSTGLKVLINGGELGPRGQVTYAEGMYTVMNKVLGGILDNSISSTTGDIEKSSSIIDGKIDSLYKKINHVEEQKAKLTYKMDKLEERMYKQFNDMDRAVSGLNSTKEYLKASLDALPGYTRDD